MVTEEIKRKKAQVAALEKTLKTLRDEADKLADEVRDLRWQLEPERAERVASTRGDPVVELY